ncbi:hypothetical protein [Sinorhizobium psoraleae]|uniref:Tail fiber protein n=1 Tax=Sinorhizobium psoraleae TaxID=520838 RepID=A0ABT4KBK0_9HYPH|nr:hypothetical protein [Sinorhizobium psoraleae]MCZ4089321.1 hypothetical protein [Sinorhizobium psoraleae]
MPFDSNGNYSLPNGYLAVAGQTILATQHNPPLEDIGAALSQVLLRSGVAPLSGNLSAAGFKITNAAEGSADGDYVTMSQLNEVSADVTALCAAWSSSGFLRTTAPSGWIKANGGTIGNASSGATTRANADTEELFTLFWGQFNNTLLPIQDSAGAASTRGASAAADFAANKRLPIFDLRTRYIRGADDGLGFDATITVGATQADGIKKHKHPGTTEPDTHSHTVPKGGDGGGNFAQNGPSTGGTISTNPDTHEHEFTTDDNTGGLDLETRPRSVVTLFCIKL